ncbi:unnamed protein product [Prorocentrum cordatum]|uniref:Uncharacterized protein n=1 Tax=Prorocentrum cordatum TaxID=2364126 RepID=A0ABN9Q6I6_9DINO|nr:unnamed protein product [Polarella glacialis]
MRYMVSGSAALPIPTMQSWAELSGHVLLERYGMTEIGMALSNKIDGTRYPGCVGWPLPRVRVKLQDNAILVKGALVFKEYYKNPEATKKEFTEDGWFMTGDSAQCGGPDEDFGRPAADAEGRAGRGGRHRPPPGRDGRGRARGAEVDLQDHGPLVGGHHQERGLQDLRAGEIESVLLQHERIRECAVLGQPDETWGEKVTAVCVLEGGDLTLKELREWGKERLATYKVPQELEVVAELPRNQMGKLEKKKLLERYKK